MFKDDALPQNGLIRYTKEDLPIFLTVPEKEGYNFAGWYTDSSYSRKINQIDVDTIGTKELYAKWTKCIDGNRSIQMYSYQTSSVSDTASKKLRNCKYDFLTDIKIPGMPATREADVMENKIADASQCPQGICMTDEIGRAHV